MVIAFNGLCLTNTFNGAGYYTLQLAIELGKQCPDHRFLLFTDETFEFSLPTNVRVMSTGKKVISLLNHRRWLRSTLPKLMRKNRVNVLISLDGSFAHTSTPQFGGINDLEKINSLSFGVRLWWQKKQLRQSVEKSRRFIVASTQIQSTIEQLYPASKDNIQYISKAALPLFKPLDIAEQQMWRDDITGGKQYFFYNAGGVSADAFVKVLKAFSTFKKWQESDMKLVVTGVSKHRGDDRAEKLNSYRYRDDIIVMHRVSHRKLHQLYSAAYAFIFFPAHTVFGVPVLEAMQSGTPCITCNLVDPGVTADAVLLADDRDSDEIAAHLIRLYKDEDLRSNFIAKGVQHAAAFSWESVAAQWWQLINTTT